MLFATVTLLVAGVSVSQCLSCDRPGVVPAPPPNKFALCTYNEEGDLVAKLHPCSDGASFTGDHRWEMVSRQDCVVRKRREAVEELPKTENKTESLKELATETSLQPDKEDSSDATENAGGETSQADETPAGTQPSQTDDETQEGAATTEGDKETTDAATTEGDKETTDAATTDGVKETTDSPTTEPTTSEPEATTLKPNSNGTKHVECWYPGVTCASCSEAAFCVGMGTLKNGQPLVRPVTTVKCGNGEVCVETLGCVSDKNRFCTKGVFTCTDQGLFPDPYDCRMFHSCVFLNGVFYQDDNRCLAGAYNSKTGTCGYPLNSATCLNKPLPHCKQEFEVGAVPSNSNMYYVCVKRGKALLPSLFRCPGGLKFTTALFRCMP